MKGCSFYGRGGYKLKGKSPNCDLPFVVRESALLLHQELHHNFSGVCNRGAGTEDGGNAGFVEEVIVLCSIFSSAHGNRTGTEAVSPQTSSGTGHTRLPTPQKWLCNS